MATYLPSKQSFTVQVRVGVPQQKGNTVMNGIDLLKIHQNGMMFVYLDLVTFEHGDDEVNKVQVIAEQMIIESTRITTPAEFTAYLESLVLPDVDHSKYWLLGL